MKFFYIFLILALVYSNEISGLSKENLPQWGQNFTLGICMDRTLMSSQEFSIIRYLNNQSEVYGTFGGFIIFTANFGVGYRYYFNSRHKSSFFSGISLNKGFGGNPGGSSPIQMSAINLSFGKTFKSTNFLVGILPMSNNKNTFINLGLVLSYNNFFESSNYEFKLLPMINLEIKTDW
tara:strand:+ start:4908 stop:5441 length:534 start_codon:yes stop_codon:yes gene_type:complete